MSLAVLAFASLSVSSCLKDQLNNSDPAAGTNNVVEFQDIGLIAASGSVYPLYNLGGLIFTNDTSGFDILINWAGPQATAPQDITVNLALSTDGLAAYNADQGKSYVAPPAELYSFPASVILPKGQSQVYVHISVNLTANFDFSANYALPLAIASASFGTVSTNFGTALYAFGGRNQWDGLYKMSGYALRAGDPVLTGYFTTDMGLSTDGPNGVDFSSSVTGNLQPWGNLTGVGVGTPLVTINPDNSLTLSSSGAIMNTPGYNNRYDPATKTFYISFTWGAGPTSRLAIDTLVFESIR
jgi:hypothetical protein